MTLLRPWLLLLIPPAIWWALRVRSQAARRGPALFHPLLAGPPDLEGRVSHRLTIHRWATGLGVTGLLFVLLAAAGPRGAAERVRIVRQAPDVLLILDVSLSMDERDGGERSRLEVARAALRRLVERRPATRFGLLLFARTALTVCPLTTDHEALLKALATRGAGVLGEGTAIGTAIATAVEHIETTGTTARVAILVTDGDNNAGPLAPVTAARLAAARGVDLHAVSLLSEPLPFPPFVRTYRADDPAALDAIIGAIDETIPRAEVETFLRRESLATPLLLAALVCLATDLLVRTLILPVDPP